MHIHFIKKAHIEILNQPFQFALMDLQDRGLALLIGDVNLLLAVAPAWGISALAHGSGSARHNRYLMTWKFFVSASEVLKSALVCSTWSTWCPLVRIAEANLHQRRAGDKAYSAYFNPPLIPRYLSNLPLNILMLWDVTMFSVRLFQLEHTLFPLFTWRPILLLTVTLNNTPAPPASSGPSGRRRVTK